MKNKHNTPYFGFLEGINPKLKERAKRKLTGTSVCRIGTHTIAGDVVEEIVRRGGVFYTADEARGIAPISIEYDDVFCASFRYLDNEYDPSAACSSAYGWCALTVYQYSYGIYLKKLIANGTISISDLKEAGGRY